MDWAALVRRKAIPVLSILVLLRKELAVSVSASPNLLMRLLPNELGVPGIVLVLSSSRA